MKSDYINRLNFQTAQHHYDQQEHPRYWADDPEMDEQPEQDVPPPKSTRSTEPEA